MIRQSEFAPQRAHFILEKLTQRLDEFQIHALRQTADIVVRFDRHRRAAVKRYALNDVRIERSLREEFRAVDFPRLRLEHVNEGCADDLALLLRIVDALELAEKQIFRFNMDKRDIVAVTEEPDDFRTLALAADMRPHQPGVDENAGELFADRFMDEHRRNGGINAAGKPADNPRLADLLADPGNRFGAE